MKNILIVSGGDRQGGNTAQLADAFARGACDAGHSVEQVSLLKTEVKGCLGCNACKRGAPCVQRDGFADILPLFERCDLLVLASPLYYWTISSRLKAFIERLYSVAAPDPGPPLGRYERYPAIPPRTAPC